MPAIQQPLRHRLSHIADAEISDLHRRSPKSRIPKPATPRSGLHGGRFAAGAVSGLHCRSGTKEDAMGPNLVDYLLYEPEDNGILWIKFNRPERMNALVGTAEENGTVAKVGEYMRAGDDDPNIRVIVLTGVGRGFCSGANLGTRAAQDITGENLPGNRGAHDGPDAARQHFFHGFTDLHRDISLIRKPTVAMVNGPASSAITMPGRSSRMAAPITCPRWLASGGRWNSPIPAKSTPSGPTNGAC